MKNICALISLLLSLMCQAQTESKHSLSAGLLFNGTSMNNNTLYNATLYTGGVSVNYIYQYRKELSLVTGIDYLQKGGTGNVNYYNSMGDKVGGYEQNLYLNYFQIPLLLRFETPLIKNKEKDKPSRLIGMAGFGGYAALLADAWTNPEPIGVNHNISKQFNVFDAGLITNVGIAYPINKQCRINLGWYYDFGFSEVSTTYKSNTQCSSLQIALQIKLKKNQVEK
jgi:hypothetical protein